MQAITLFRRGLLNARALINMYFIWLSAESSPYFLCDISAKKTDLRDSYAECTQLKRPNHTLIFLIFFKEAVTKFALNSI